MPNTAPKGKAKEREKEKVKEKANQAKEENQEERQGQREDVGPVEATTIPATVPKERGNKKAREHRLMQWVLQPRESIGLEIGEEQANGPGWIRFPPWDASR